MAFWRLFAMDSWNPTNKNFWTIQNLVGESELEEKRNQLKDQLVEEINPIFKDPVTYDVPEKPVFTPTGYLLNENKLALADSNTIHI